LQYRLSQTCCLEPSFVSIVLSLKISPDAIKLAKLPVFKLPISLLFPKIAAGIVVNASSAFVLSNPYLMALVG
jgi:hypothetical protein